MARPKRFADLGEFGAHIESFDGSRLNRRQAYESGNLAALYDALAEAATTAKKANRQTADAPLWMLEGAMECLKAYILAARTQQASGPNNRWAKQFRRDAIDWHRYQLVWVHAIARDADHAAHPDAPSIRKSRRAYHRAQRAKGSSHIVHPQLPYPWTDGTHPDDWSVFEAAAKTYPIGSPYAGQEGEMKKSWERVTRALKRGEIWRYYPSCNLRFPGQLLSVEHLRD